MKPSATAPASTFLPYSSEVITNFLTILGVLGFYLFSLTAFIGTDGHKVAFYLISAGAIWHLSKIWPFLSKNPLFWTIFLLFIYVLLRGFLGQWEWPQQWGTLRSHTFHLTEVTGLTAIILGVWATGEKIRKRLAWGIILATGSFLVDIAEEINWQNITQQLSHRPELGMHPNVYGPIFLVLFHLILSVGLGKGEKIFRQGIQFPHIFLFLCWVGILGILLEGVITSQSRQTWLAAIAVYSGLGLAALFHLIRRKKSKKTTAAKAKFGVAVTATMALLIIALASQVETFSNRLTDDTSSLAQVASGEWDQIPSDTIGIRLGMWHLAWKNWKESPLFGQAPGSSEILLQAEGSRHLQRFDHVHSFYFQTLMETGLLGATGFVLVIVLLGSGINQAWRKGVISLDLYLGWAGSVGMLLISGLADWRIQQEEFRFILILLGAIGVAAHLTNRGFSGFPSPNVPPRRAG